MAHDTHGAAHPHPENTGPPPYLRDRGGFAIGAGAMLFVLISIILSIAQGAQVVGLSGWGHIWPASQSATLKLPPAHLTQQQ
jgi:hypothetical protein